MNQNNKDKNNDNGSSLKEKKKLNLDNFSYYISHFSVDTKYKDNSQQGKESEILHLVLIRADRSK